MERFCARKLPFDFSNQTTSDRDPSIVNGINEKTSNAVQLEDNQDVNAFNEKAIQVTSVKTDLPIEFLENLQSTGIHLTSLLDSLKIHSLDHSFAINYCSLYSSNPPLTYTNMR